MRYLLAQINPVVGDLAYNCEKILEAIAKAKETSCSLVLFPEMTLIGYPAQDLLQEDFLVENLSYYLEKICNAAKNLCVVLGTVRKNKEAFGKALCNSAAIIIDGKLVAYHDKMLLPTYDVFDEARYFSSGKSPTTFIYQGKKIAVFICEDIWQNEECRPLYYSDPIEELGKEKIDLVLHIAASPYTVEKYALRQKVLAKTALALHCEVLFCNQVGANDGLIFDGRSGFMDSQGNLLQQAALFCEDLFLVEPTKKMSAKKPLCLEEEMIGALVLGIADYCKKQGFTKAVVAVSGGIDSALVLYLAQKALGKSQVQALFLPSRFTSVESHKDAMELVENLSISCKTIPIDSLLEQFFVSLDPVFSKPSLGVTKENLQSRIRGMLIMAYSNEFGHLVLSTGNKSEHALGYCTLYGDLCGAISVLADVKKTEVYRLVSWICRQEKGVIPENILHKEPSAELKEGQKDSDTLPCYSLIDTIITEYLEEQQPIAKIAKRHGWKESFVLEIVRKIHQAQYKRNQAPFGLRITKKCFSKGRCLPIAHRLYSDSV